MKSIKVKELMVPLAEYAIVSEEATLYEAIMALEETHERSRPEHERHRAVLVLDRNDQLVGKLNIWDVLRGIEPRYKELAYPREASSSPAYGSAFIRSMLETYGLWRKPLSELCAKAGEMSVREVMHIPAQAEFIDEESTLDEAVHQIVMGHHQSLIVTRNENVTGILRLSDVFKAICDGIRACRS